MTIHDIRHLFSRPLVIAVATTCVTAVVLAQQPAQQPHNLTLRRLRVRRSSMHDPTRQAPAASPR
jgi:hypothetical protein